VDDQGRREREAPLTVAIGEAEWLEARRLTKPVRADAIEPLRR